MKTNKQRTKDLSKLCLEALVLEKEKRDIYNSAYKSWEESCRDFDLGKLVDIAYEDYQNVKDELNILARLFLECLSEGC